MDNQNLQSIVTQLQQQVSELMQWKNDRMAQQISNPLDNTSFNILNKYFASINNSFFTSGGAAGNVFQNILLSQNKKVFPIGTYNKFIGCSANASTDVITLGNDFTTGTQGILYDDSLVEMIAPDPGDTPTGIDNGSAYWVVSASGNTIKLSATKGGTAINFTSNGTGPQYILY